MYKYYEDIVPEGHLNSFKMSFRLSLEIPSDFSTYLCTIFTKNFSVHKFYLRDINALVAVVKEDVHDLTRWIGPGTGVGTTAISDRSSLIFIPTCKCSSKFLIVL